VELVPGLFQLTLPLPFRLNHVHVYLVEADDGFILVDTGVNTPDAYSCLKRKLEDIGLHFRDISQVVITHFHSDHCGQAARIRHLGGAQVVMGELERTVWEGVQNGLDDQREEQFLRHGLPPQQAKAHGEVLPYLKSLSTPCDIDRSLGHGQTLVAKPRRLEAFITPGHTPGHVCLLLPEEKLMFSGDHILQKITPNIGMHPYSGPDPLGDYLHSLQATLGLGARQLLPSHGALVEDPEARIRQLLLHHDRRLESHVEALGAVSHTAYAVSLQVFGDALDHLGRWMAMGETLAHLEHLVRRGQVVKVCAGGEIRYQRA
jgi:glyoxylase-like metal-dependent hydrolase (beta-lactamase superfamily II)